MTSLEESRLDSLLKESLKGIEGLPESARSADETITEYLRQKLGELMVGDYRKKSDRDVDGAAATELATQILDRVLGAQRLYDLFELHLKKRLDGFWEGLDPAGARVTAGSGGGIDAARQASDSRSAPSLASSASTRRTSAGSRRFYCTEGCEIEGDLEYLAHRDRGHHPVPG
jgi:hypothetical protein